MRHTRSISRRRFLKNSLLFASAPIICPFPLFGEDAPGNRMNLALVGCGEMGVNDMKTALGCGANVIAVCDVDESMSANAIRAGGTQMQGTTVYRDYRQLLDKEKTLDGVIIATPDHWHAAICGLHMRANKHVYCEKPLTRTIGEARDIRGLARASGSVTQMGNQGSAYGSMRRGIEVIQAGALGTLSSAHVVSPGERYPTGVNRPAGEDPIPKGLDWDFWVGPSPMRPYKTDIYHPYKWRGWHDFGTGQIGNWATHSLNLPIRALNLGFPNKVEVSGQGFGFETYWTGGTITYHFPTTLQGARFTVYWYENLPTPEAFQGLAPNDEGSEGVVLIGEKGRIYTNPHNGHVLIKLEGESGWKDITHHEPTRSIPVTLPRVRGHMQEWIDACKGGPKPFSNFELASRMTETCLLGLLATQLGHGFEYDAETQSVIGAPADELINPKRRTKWLAT
jgi:predicted dehydrogenase